MGLRGAGDSSMMTGDSVDILKAGEFLPEEMTRMSSLSEMMDDCRVPDDDRPSRKME